MRPFHLVVASCATIFLLITLHAAWGPVGAAERAELDSYRERLERSIANLEDANARMADDLSRLSADADRLRLEAHAIGMVASDEVRIKIPHALGVHTGPLTPAIAEVPESKAIPPALISGVALSAGVLILLALTLFDADRGGEGRRTSRRSGYHQGMRVQTASRE